jgi:hypothetical protein
MPHCKPPKSAWEWDAFKNGAWDMIGTKKHAVWDSHVFSQTESCSQKLGCSSGLIVDPSEVQVSLHTDHPPTNQPTKKHQNAAAEPWYLCPAQTAHRGSKPASQP